MEVEVTDGFNVVDVGQKAPASMNRTLGDGAPLEELSSAHEADPELYSTSIADALEQGQPHDGRFLHAVLLHLGHLRTPGGDSQPGSPQVRGAGQFYSR